MRPTVHAYLGISLDGFIARPDGGLDWLESAGVSGEDYGYDAFFAGVDTLLVGRETHAVVCGFAEWPWAGKRVAVLTHRPLAPAHGESAHAGPLRPVLDALGAAGARSVYVDGGSVVRQALAEGCLDTLTLTVVPRLLGAGRPLFGGVDASLRLESVARWPSGMAQLRYALGAGGPGLAAPAA